MQKLNKLRINASPSSSTGSPPATPFNSTTFLMGLQELREFKNSSYHQPKFDQYGSMERLLARWPLDELSPDRADFINDGYGNAHGDALIASFSPTARSSGDDHAISEHGVIAGSSCADSVDEDGRIV
jgi:hypothetical protein